MAGVLDTRSTLVLRRLSMTPLLIPKSPNFGHYLPFADLAARAESWDNFGLTTHAPGFGHS
jgi:hypothetical protein